MALSPLPPALMVLLPPLLPFSSPLQSSELSQTSINIVLELPLPLPCTPRNRRASVVAILFASATLLPTTASLCGPLELSSTTREIFTGPLLLHFTLRRVLLITAAALSAGRARPLLLCHLHALAGPPSTTSRADVHDHTRCDRKRKIFVAPR